jgi:hypothetical protein
VRSFSPIEAESRPPATTRADARAVRSIARQSTFLLVRLNSDRSRSAKPRHGGDRPNPIFPRSSKIFPRAGGRSATRFPACPETHPARVWAACDDGGSVRYRTQSLISTNNTSADRTGQGGNYRTLLPRGLETFARCFTTQTLSRWKGLPSHYDLAWRAGLHSGSVPSIEHRRFWSEQRYLPRCSHQFIAPFTAPVLEAAWPITKRQQHEAVPNAQHL